jgi:hypothetical protein
MRSDSNNEGPTSGENCEWLLLEIEAPHEENPFIVRIRGAKPPGISVEDYPVLINLCWFTEETSDNGMPTPEALDTMLEMEELLNGLDGESIGFMMFSVTGNGRKEWVWYVKDQDAFIEGLNRCLGGHDEFPIEIESAPAGNWDTYEDLIASVEPEPAA